MMGQSDLSLQEQDRLLDVLQYKSLYKRTTMLILLETGMRPYEARKLTIGDVRRAMKLEVPYFYVRNAKKRKDAPAEYRIIPIRKQLVHPNHHITLFHSLREYLRAVSAEKDGGFIYSWRKKRAALSTKDVGMGLRPIFREAGIPHGCLLSLRHTFAMNRLREGVSIFVLQKLLGHTNIENTAKYVLPRKEHIFAAMGYPTSDPIKPSRYANIIDPSTEYDPDNPETVEEFSNKY